MERLSIRFHVYDGAVRTYFRALGLPLAEIASHDRAFPGVHTGAAERAGQYAHPAPDAALRVGFHGSGAFIPLDCTRGAGFFAGGFGALLADHRDAAHIEVHLDDIYAGTRRVAGIGVRKRTEHLADAAPQTFLRIDQKKFCHGRLSFGVVWQPEKGAVEEPVPGSR